MESTKENEMTEAQMVEVQRALDQMVDSIDVAKLGEVMGRQMVVTVDGIECRKCGRIVKNARGLSVHGRTHR